jgi:hypothetical protein
MAALSSFCEEKIPLKNINTRHQTIKSEIKSSGVRGKNRGEDSNQPDR